MGMGCPMEVVQSIASNFHYKVGKSPFTYLGLPVGAPSRSKAVWDPALNFNRKLSSWKRSFLFGRQNHLD